MSSPAVIVLGCRVRPLERVAIMGETLGLGCRATAYRTAERDEWPMCAGYVIVPALLARLGIPYEVADPEEVP